MQAVPHPNAEETRDNSAFDALLWALSRPGLPRTLPGSGEQVIVSALLDRECRVHSAEPRLVPDIMRTGAEISEIGQADHVFFGSMSNSDAIHQVAIGSDFYPDDGATVVIRAKIGVGQPLRLSGPGVNGSETIQLQNLPDGFWAARRERMRYPMGFDVFFVDDARVLGLPRSTEVEVL